MFEEQHNFISPVNLRIRESISSEYRLPGESTPLLDFPARWSNAWNHIDSACYCWRWQIRRGISSTFVMGSTFCKTILERWSLFPHIKGGKEMHNPKISIYRLTLTVRSMYPVLVGERSSTSWPIIPNGKLVRVHLKHAPTQTWNTGPDAPVRRCNQSSTLGPPSPTILRWQCHHPRKLKCPSHVGSSIGVRRPVPAAYGGTISDCCSSSYSMTSKLHVDENVNCRLSIENVIGLVLLDREESRSWGRVESWEIIMWCSYCTYLQSRWTFGPWEMAWFRLIYFLLQ